MKKIYFFFLLLIAGITSSAQSFQKAKQIVGSAATNFSEKELTESSSQSSEMVSEGKTPVWYMALGSTPIGDFSKSTVLKFQICEYSGTELTISNLFPGSPPKFIGSILGNLDSNAVINIYKDNKIYYSGNYKDNYRFKINQSGLYFVQVTNSCCSALSQSFEVQISNILSSTNLSTNSICNGNQYEYFANDRILQPFSNIIPVEIDLYKESKKIDSISTETNGLKSFSFNLSDAGQYQIILKKKFTSGECIYKDDKLNLIVSDTIWLAGNDKSIFSCRDFEVLDLFDSKARLFLTDVVTDSWYKDGSPIPGSGNLSYYQAKETGTYKFIAKNTNGCVMMSPDFKLEKGKITPKLQSVVEFEISSCIEPRNWRIYGSNENQSLDNATINIYKDGTFIKQIFSGDNYRTNSPGSYFAKVEQNGCFAETPVLELKPFPVMPSLASSLNVIIIGNQPEIIKVNNTPTSEVIWEKDGELIFGQRDSLKITSPGKYAVYLKDYMCSYYSGVAEVKSLDSLKPTLSFGNIDYCKLGYQEIKLNIPDVIIPSEILWYRNGALLENNNKSIIKASERGEYYCKVRVKDITYLSPSINYSLNETMLNMEINIGGQSIYSSGEYVGKFNEPLKKIEICEFANYNLYIFNRPKNSSPQGHLGSETKIEIFKDNKVYIEKDYGTFYSIKLNEPGVYFIKASSPYCNSLSQSFELQIKNETESLNVEKITMCKGATYEYRLFDNNFMDNYGIPVEFELYKNSNKISSQSGYSPIKDFTYIKETGKYRGRLITKFKGGNCIYNYPIFDVDVKDTVLIGKEDKIISSCDSLVHLNFNDFNINNFLVNGTGGSWYKDGKQIPNSGLIFYDAKESGVYKINAKTDKGCVIISKDIKVEMGKLEPVLKEFMVNNYENNSCNKESSKGLNLDNINLADYSTSIVDYYKGNTFIKQIKGQPSALFIQEPGFYKAKLQYKGCTAETPLFEVKAEPEKPVLGSSIYVSLCENRPETIKVNNTPTSSVIWEKDGELIFGQRDSLKITTPGKYAVYLKDSNCSYYSGIAEVKSLTLLKETNLTGDVNFCPGGENAILKALSPDSTVKYSLVKGGENLSANFTGVFPIGVKGIYSIHQQKDNCSITSNPINFKYKIDERLLLSDTLFCKGATVTLTATSGQDFKYSWYKDRIKLESENSHVLKTNVMGNYKVQISGNDCEVISDNYKIVQRPDLSAGITGDATIDYGQSAKLSVNFTSTPPYSFTVNNGVGQITTSDNPYTFNVSPQVTTLYKIDKVSNICGDGLVAGSAEVKVIILSLEKENKLRVYPNPTSDLVFVDGKSSAFKEIRVFNAFGKTLLQTQSNFESGLNVSNLTPGIYTIKVITDSKTETFKLIKY